MVDGIALRKSVVNFLYPLFLVIILLLFEFMSFLLLKFNVFNKHREKYAKLDFIKSILLEINYFVETCCFCF